MLRPSFVPPAAIRRVRDSTRARQDLVAERTRCLQRVEKLLEDAMIKVTSVAKDGMKAKSVVAMVAALAAGERDPGKLADLVKGPDREAATHQGKHGTEERTALAFVVGDGHRPELRELAEVTFGRVAAI
jgi:hypothetical protein